MANRCFVCGKGVSFARSVSHSKKATLTKQLPNLQKVKVLIGSKKKRIKVCTKCLKAGKVQKVA